jgi:hypothetical protein
VQIVGRVFLVWQKAKAPAPDELEVSVLGPGFGEAILIHAGNNLWIAVDSCVDKDGNCATLQYLNAIGVSSHQVKHIVATHWHADHIRGLGDLLTECDDAEFYCPNVFVEHDFFDFIAAYSEQDVSPLGATTTDLARVFEILQQRNQQPKYVGPDRTLLNENVPTVTLLSLSPSDARIGQFLNLIGQHRVAKGQSRRPVRDLHPNLVSVVLRVVFGDDAALLGADLQEIPHHGWSEIIDHSQVLDGPRATLFKIPHHGSENAHHDGQWSKLCDAPTVVLTPWHLAAHMLPRQSDVDRILKQTDKAFSAARTASIASRKLDPGVARSLAEANIRLRTSEIKMGHVQLRRKRSAAVGDWSVEMYGNAVHLRHIAA